MATLETDIRQLSSDEIVEGAVPLTTLQVSPLELTNRIGIEWSTGSDELGDYQSAIVETGPANDPYVLLCYETSDPLEITLLGQPERIENLDEALRSLRVPVSEVVDRVDRPTRALGIGAASAASIEQVRAYLERSIGSLQVQLDALQAEVETSRLASLASIEDAELTPRQREVLQLMISGLSAGEVADRLHVARSTVLGHLRAVRNALIHQQ